MELNASFFETIVNSVGGGMVVANTKSEIVYANPGFCEMLGYGEGELIGKTVIEITHEKDAPESREKIKEMLSKPGTFVEMEKVYKKANGEKLYGFAKGHSQEINGETVLVAFVTDITDQRRRRMMIEEQYKEIVDNAGDIIFTTTIEGDFIYVNSCASDITGIPHHELIKMNYLDLISESHKLEVFKYYHQAFVEQKEHADLIFPIVNTKGDIIWLDQKLTTIWNEKKTRILGYSAFARDITTQVEMETRLRESESHYQALFDHSIVPLRMEDFSEVKAYLEEIRAKGVRNFAKYFKENPEEVTKCVSLVKVLEKNQRVLELHDAKKEEGLQENITQVFTDEAYETFRDELVSIAEGNPTFEAETKVRTINGEDRYIQLTWMAMPGFEDTLEKVMISTYNITESVKAEKAIKDSQRYYQLLFDESPIPLWLEDLAELKEELVKLKTSGVKNFKEYIAGNPAEMFKFFPLIKVVEVNNQVLQLHGAQSKAELIDNFSSVFAEKSMAGLVKVISDVFDDKTSGQVESVVYTLDGEERNIMLRWQPIEKAKGDFSRVLISTIDITEKVQIQRSVEESEQRLSSIFKGLGVPIVISDPDDCGIVDFNESALEATGYSKDELLSMSVDQLDSNHDFEYVKKALRRCFREGLVEGQTNWIMADGTIRDITVRNSLINFGGKPRVLSACMDITELKKLNDENERFRAVMEHAPFAIYITDMEQESLIDVNRTACEQLGYTREEILGLAPGDIEQVEMIQDDQQKEEHFSRLISEEATELIDGIHKRKDGSTFPVKVSVSARVLGGKPYLIASVFDNTESAIAERKLKEQNIELIEIQKKLSESNKDLMLQIDLKYKAQKSLVNSEERERKRMAQELHDGLGQRLTAAKLSLGAIKNSKVLSGDMETILKDSIKIIEGSMSEVRQISHNLLPSVITDFGLEEGLEKLCTETSELTGRKVSFTSVGSVNALEDHIGIVLYRIVQEAINNAVKYAQSETISVKIKSNKKSLNLEIKDDGLGFDEGKVKRGMGLNNMAERADLINAQFSLQSIPNKGTTIKVIYYF